MKVKDVMMGTPYYCQPETNLGSATELMWNANCGFLPVVGSDGKVAGVITDRDICIALGTRGKLSGEITVGEVMVRKIFSCRPEEDIHRALETMKDGRVRRLPVISATGTLVGVVSMDDVVLHAEAAGYGKRPELSSEEVVHIFQAITQRQVPQAVHS
ncbi:MAG: CBS domain-containing protein [Acidobacteriia bacterium]|nr:CBS domain-containing protein [Terriglobia bacterium]